MTLAPSLDASAVVQAMVDERHVEPLLYGPKARIVGSRPPARRRQLLATSLMAQAAVSGSIPPRHRSGAPGGRSGFTSGALTLQVGSSSVMSAAG